MERVNRMNELTQTLNWDIEADYIETALHILNLNAGQSLRVWRTSRGKWISELVLMQLVKDDIVTYTPPTTRNMWETGSYAKAF